MPRAEPHSTCSAQQRNHVNAAGGWGWPASATRPTRGARDAFPRYQLQLPSSLRTEVPRRAVAGATASGSAAAGLAALALAAVIALFMLRALPRPARRRFRGATSGDLVGLGVRAEPGDGADPRRGWADRARTGSRRRRAQWRATLAAETTRPPNHSPRRRGRYVPPRRTRRLDRGGLEQERGVALPRLPLRSTNGP